MLRRLALALAAFAPAAVLADDPSPVVVPPLPSPYMVKAIRPTSGSSGNSAQYTALGDLVFFSADDGVTGSEPWVSDGTPAGTMPLADINPTSGSSPFGYHPFRNELIFAAMATGTSAKMYATDGTPANTRYLHDMSFGSSIVDDALATVQDWIVWKGRGSTNNNAGLWVSDGTSSSVTRIMDLYAANPRGVISEILSLGDDWLMIVSQDKPDLPINSPNIGGFELWLTDGTAANTFRLTNPALPWRSIEDITLAGDFVYFRGLGPTGQFPTNADFFAVNVANFVPEPASTLILLIPLSLRRRRR